MEIEEPGGIASRQASSKLVESWEQAGSRLEASWKQIFAKEHGKEKRGEAYGGNSVQIFSLAAQLEV